MKVSYGNNQSDLLNNFVFSDPRLDGPATAAVVTLNQLRHMHKKLLDIIKMAQVDAPGNMKCGTDVLFTDKSHDEVQLSAPHQHNPNNYQLEGKFQVISPGLRTDIKLNTVRIDNTPGINYGIINVETATAFFRNDVTLSGHTKKMQHIHLKKETWWSYRSNISIFTKY